MTNQVVALPVGASVRCARCEKELTAGDLVVVESSQTFCLSCARKRQAAVGPTETKEERPAAWMGFD